MSSDIFLIDFLVIIMLSIALTGIVIILSKFLNKFFNSFIEIDVISDDFKMKNHCNLLFPREFVDFKGIVIKRGNYVRIKAYTNNEYEGIFIGVNNDKTICLITLNHIISFKIDGIETIEMKELEVY